MDNEFVFNPEEGLNIGGQNTVDLANPQDGGQDTVDLANPQTGGNTSAEPAQPQGDIRGVSKMTDADFSEYISKVSNGLMEEPSRPTPAGGAEGMAADEPKTDEKPFRTFATKEEYQNDLNERFNSRYRVKKENEEAVSELKNMAHEVYGEDLKLSEIISRVKKELIESGASQANKEPSEYEEELQIKLKAKAYEDIQNRQKEQSEVLGRWQREASELKAMVPDFDLERAMNNPDFYQSMVAGKSVAQSYINAFANKKPKERTISQNAAKSSQMGSTAKKDPSTMSDAEFRAYIDKIKNI